MSSHQHTWGSSGDQSITSFPSGLKDGTVTFELGCLLSKETEWGNLERSSSVFCVLCSVFCVLPQPTILLYTISMFCFCAARQQRECHRKPNACMHINTQQWSAAMLCILRVPPPSTDAVKEPRPNISKCLCKLKHPHIALVFLICDLVRRTVGCTMYHNQNGIFDKGTNPSLFPC